MDDEIDIEEHDILQHPQVKAVFPDLSKLQIQVHESGASFLKENSERAEFKNLLEERQDYTDSNIEDGIPEDVSSKTVQEEHELKESVEEFTEENEDLVIPEKNEFLEDVHAISDSEDALAVPLIPSNGDLEVMKENDVLELSEDEFIDEAQYHATNKLVDEAAVAIELAKSLNTVRNEIMIRKLVENVYEISDDEVQSQELEENGDDRSEIDVFPDKTPADEVIEDTLKKDDVDGLIEDRPKNCEFEDHAINENQDEKDIEHNQKHETMDQDEYQPVHIKEEIEEDSMTGFDETLTESFNNEELPPEDIYHFNNKIILGSKPSPQNNERNLIKSNLVVLLENWDVRLARSQSYCNDCETLFTTPNALDSHRMTVHSLLAPITNRALKSTAKTTNIARANIAKKSTVAQKISNSTYCHHCNITFKDHTTLIKHLYKLLPVKQYNCKTCDATFQSQNDLVKHNSVHVKVEPRKILKAKSSENSILKQLLNNGMKAMTSKAVKRPLEKPSKHCPVKIQKQASNNWWTNKFKCVHCGIVFGSYTIARKHRLVHPEVPALDKMFQKLPSKNPHNSKEKLVYEDDSKASALTSSKGDKHFELIPKSALFQCSKCSLHFTSCVAGASHFSANRCNDNVSWSCPTCKRKFRKRDEICHRKQHEVCTKFKIYKVTKFTYEKTLCKCLKCGVHFEYIALKAHIMNCGKIPTVKCQKCNILISKSKLAEHTKRHDVMKLKPKDFILVDYAVANDKNKKTVASKINTDVKSNRKDLSFLLGKTIKQEENVDEGTVQKIVNKLKYEKDKVKLFYCKHCNSFLTKRPKPHFTKQCVGRYNHTSSCTHCGLQIFYKYRNRHERLHVENNFTLKDFEFLDFATRKPITPPIPKYPSCGKCQIHFLDKKMITQHICGEDYENCKVCGEKFENAALALHLPFHELQTERKTKPKIIPKIMPELIMKYESLNAIWNILFICGKCDLVTDLYNKAVEHSQAHLKKDNTQTNTIKCYICNLKFDENCWSKHSELHSRMSISNTDFKILQYTPKNLLDESWFQMFESLPEKEIRQIIDRSVFGSERSLKMRLVKDGLPEFTLYCCSVCQVSYDNSDILGHVNDNCRISKHVCRECEIAFDAESTLNFHVLLHRKGIKKDEFRIVNFVKDTSKSVNVKDKIIAKPKQVAKSQKPVLKVKKAIDVVIKYVLYKCVECSVCVQVASNRSSHICAPDHHLVYCRLCKQNFSFRQMGAHREKHKRLPDFRAKSMKIIAFEPTPEGKDKPTRKMPRKEKRVPSSKSSVASSVSSETQSAEIEPSSSNSKRRSSVHSFESLVNLVTSDLAKPKARKTLNSSKHDITSLENSDTEDKRNSKVYKCDCGLHYTSLRSIEKHIKTCDSGNEISKENCSKCRLLFPTDVLVSHLCKHHSQDTKITVESVHKRTSVTEATSTQVPKTVKDSVKLYKCSDCNVYFLNQNSCYKHTSRHEPLDPKQYIECKMCCLQFRILSLHIHMKKHHEKEFNLEKVLVEEYHPSVGKQAPRIDIYYASERFQNIQVSSSND